MNHRCHLPAANNTLPEGTRWECPYCGSTWAMEKFVSEMVPITADMTTVGVPGGYLCWQRQLTRARQWFRSIDRRTA